MDGAGGEPLKGSTLDVWETVLAVLTNVGFE